nr:SufE family protein [Aestuariibacter sp. A3R04]
MAEAVKRAKGWDQTLRAVMLAGKHLRSLPSPFHTAQFLVPGCQSNVWLRQDPDTGVFQAWSDAKVMRGVLALLMEYTESVRSEITQSAVQQYLSELHLDRVLTTSRANGINTVVARLCEARRIP